MDEWIAPRLPLRWTNAEQPPFVGRGDEVDRLDAAWSQARGGSGRAVFILGEPGVGKSRLIGEACRRWHRDGAVVVVGVAVPEFGAPYEPLVEPLRVLAPLARDRLAREGDPEALQVVAAALGRKGSVSAPAVGQGRLYDSVVAVLRAAASGHPILLVLEDLQWADEGTVRLLTRIVETTPDSPVLVVASARTTVPDRSAPLIEAIARLARLSSVGRIDLRALSAPDVMEYLARRTGMSPDAVSEPARLLRELTGGNPFLLRETWQEVMAVSARQTDGVEMPESVNDLLRERILTLDATSQDVLVHAAVLGQEVQLTELLAVCDRTPGETLDGMDAAVASGLLEPPRLVHEAYRFPHAIARQAVLDQLPATRLARVHQRVAIGLQQNAPNASRLVQRLAHHFSAARSLGYTEEAVVYLVKSAEQAESKLAHEEAGRLFERASQFCAQKVEADDLRLRAARSWVMTADFARARDLLEPVATGGSPSQQREAAIGYEEASWRPGLDGRRAVELLTDAARSEMSPADRIRVDSALARALAYTGEVDRGTDIAADAVRRARDLGDPVILTVALRYSVTVSTRPMGLHRRLAQASELRALSEPGDETYNAGATFRSMACYIVGDASGLDTVERDLLATASRTGAYWHYWIHCQRFGRALIAGKLGIAAEAAKLITRAELEFKSDRNDGVFAVQTYMLERETRAITRVSRLLNGEESTRALWAPGLLALYTELELVEPARRALRETLAHAAHRPHESADWPAWLAFMSDAATWLEDSDAAAQLRPALAEFTGMNLLAGWFGAPLGSADRYLAELDSVCGHGDPEIHFRAALTLDEQTGAPLHGAYTQLAWARHLRRTKADSLHIAALEGAVQTRAEREGWARVMWMLRRQQGRRGAVRVDGLSERELDVIRLLADGCSNRDIAHRLVISEHTAANHVRSILMKTNSANRTQAAVYARQHDLIAEASLRAN